MRQAILLAGFAVVCPTANLAAADIFADCEEIYVAVVHKVVREHTRTDRVLAITTPVGDDIHLRYLEDQLWKRLEAKGIDRTKLVPANEVVFEEENLRCFHEPSGKIAWVHEIYGFDWYGTDRLYVSKCTYRDPWDLGAVESPLAYAKQNRLWSLVEGKSDTAVERRGAPPSAAKPERILVDLEEIYLRAFETFVRDHGDLDRVLCVAMATPERTGPVKMPDRMWQQLAAKLQAKGVNLSRFVPADQIEWQEKGMQFVQKTTGKDAWVHSINAVKWYGTNRLYVPISVSHGNLAGGGETFVFEKANGKWIIVDRIDNWVS